MEAQIAKKYVDNFCPVCSGSMKRQRIHWLYVCNRCGFLKSSLKPEISLASTVCVINENLRSKALTNLRDNNFKRILERMSPLLNTKYKRLLEVGCAHGWFLDIAAALGFVVTGIEPDPLVGQIAQQKHNCIRIGFFPDSITDQDYGNFDVVIFNDVFEHLVDPASALVTCNNVLTPGGLLIINLPNSQGIFYRIASCLLLLGLRGPFERLWQKNFSSPHVSYFNPSQLQQMVSQYGFLEEHRSTLPSLEQKGLWNRLRYDRTTSWTYAVFVWLMAVILIPFLRFLPADISLQIFRKCEAP